MDNPPVPDFFIDTLEQAYKPIAKIYREILQAQIAYNQQIADDSRKCKSSITQQLLSDKTLPEAEKEKMEEFLNAAGHVNALQGGILAPFIDSVTNFLFQKIQAGQSLPLNAISDINLSHHYEPILCNPSEPAIFRIARAEGYTLFAGFFDKLAWAISNNHQHNTGNLPDYFYLQTKISELIRQYLLESKEPATVAVAIV